MEKLKDWISGNLLTLIVNIVFMTWLASNMHTRLAFAEKELDSFSGFAARVAVLESELKANTRLLEQVYGYVKANNK